MVLITIVTGAYKPTYNWGASHCGNVMGNRWSANLGIFWEIHHNRWDIIGISVSGKNGEFHRNAMGRS